MLWEKKNTAPYNSQVKIYKDNIYVVDYDNTLKAYSINNGDEIWSIKTQKSFIRSQKKLSLAIKNEKIYDRKAGQLTQERRFGRPARQKDNARFWEFARFHFGRRVELLVNGLFAS